MNSGADNRIAAYIEAWTGSLAVLLSQLTAERWEANETSPPSDYLPAFCVRITATSGGTVLWASFGRSDLSALLNMFLGEELPLPDQLDDTLREAVEELLRQWCGLAATALKDDFGEVSFQVALEPEIRSSATTHARKFLRASQDSRSIGLFLELDDSVREAPWNSLPKQDPISPAGPPTQDRVEELLQQGNLELLMNVELGVRLRFGSREATLREVLDMATGAVLELDREIQEPVDLLLNEKIIARGEVVVIDGNYGLRVSEVASPQQRFSSL